ncbi:hypothetical protein BCR33DRAFT_787891 [Rhizoclosmatium globosum]|uniref:Uncharacterized protein n=1 Tax=Rhizoclosmatium globosum TaxID=329046 RepID=A0A1Y2BYS7_9FUNG|nr:hypothetical protein BCR33DRAFT_787891 [Rhizoclosmatium globosum]|eukprot:ORY39928.1 hypothetical protein BCR33DRAFT_787891 [Rhizoclosmatium globosum]
MASLLSPTTPPDHNEPCISRRGGRSWDLDLSPFAVRNGAVDATTQILEYQDRLGPHAFGSGCGGGTFGVDEEDDGDGEVVVEVAEVEPVPWWTTSALSMRLLDPVVSAGEFKDIRGICWRIVVKVSPRFKILFRYVAQFKPAPVKSMRVPKLSSSKRSTPASHPDFEIFKSYVESAFPNPSAPLQIVIDQRDEEIYRNYVQQSGKVGNYSGDTTAGVLGKGETDEARYEAYAQWLATGKYH